MSAPALELDDLLAAVARCEDADVRDELATLSCAELQMLRAEIIRDKADEDYRVYEDDIYDDLLGLVATAWDARRATEQRQREMYREAMAEKYKNDPATLADVLARVGLVAR